MLLPIRDRLLRSEEMFLSASNEHLIQDFQHYWHTLAINILNATNAGQISSEDLALADAVSARIATFCENFEEFSRVCDDIGHAFERDLEEILEEHGQTLRHSKSETFQPPTNTAPYIRPAYHWLLHNLHNPYPPKGTRNAIAHETASDPKHVDNWFADVRKRMGWNAIRKRHFSNKRHLTVDAATTFFKSQSSNLLNDVVCHDFTAMSASAEGLYANKLGERLVLNAKDIPPVSVELDNGLEKKGRIPIRVFRSTSMSSKKCLVNPPLSSPSVPNLPRQSPNQKRSRTPEIPVDFPSHCFKRTRTEGAIRFSPFAEDSCSVSRPAFTSDIDSGRVAAGPLVSTTSPTYFRKPSNSNCRKKIVHTRPTGQTMRDPFMSSSCSSSSDDSHLQSTGTTSSDINGNQVADTTDYSSLLHQHPFDFCIPQDLVLDPQASDLTLAKPPSVDTLYSWDQLDMNETTDPMPGHSMFDEIVANLTTDNDSLGVPTSEQEAPGALRSPPESDMVAHWTSLLGNSGIPLSIPFHSIDSYSIGGMDALSSTPVDLDFGHFFNLDSQLENIIWKNIFENIVPQESPHSGSAESAFTGTIQLGKLRKCHEQLGQCIKSLEQQITSVIT